MLDNPTTNAVQATPVSTLQTLGETSASQPAGPGVALQQAVESLQATVELAARQGLTQARIQLHPAELGEIRIHLTQTSAGLLARVSAESAAAAQALISAHAELRQSLSSLGIDLAQLHVGAHEAAGADLGQQGAGSEQQAGAQQQPSAQASGDRGTGRTSAAGAAGEEPSSTEHAADPSGAIGAVEPIAGSPAALIDVLA
ncbi:MAG TPA: flagellar hook-length control protein FliK [Solirubrobacteraceae bacterium]